MNASLANARNTESGFTLIELLVVILIIGILTAIAVPAFLNQRKKANDTAVKSDMKTVVTTIETQLIENTGNPVITVGTASKVATVTVAGVTPNATVNLSENVTVTTPATPESNANGYVLHGTHTNGDKSGPDNGPIVYTSNTGGF